MISEEEEGNKVRYLILLSFGIFIWYIHFFIIKFFIGEKTCRGQSFTSLTADLRQVSGLMGHFLLR